MSTGRRKLSIKRAERGAAAVVKSVAAAVAVVAVLTREVAA
jgi:hypothetical protein